MDPRDVQSKEIHTLTLVEAIGGVADGHPSAWRVRLIDAGTSINRNRYSLAVLHEAAPLFDGVRVLSRSDEEHIQGRGKKAQNLAGWLTDPKPSPLGIDATLNISEAAGWLQTLIGDAWSRGKKDIVGLSVVTKSRWAYMRTAEGTVRDVKKIVKAEFVDVVIDPSAGSAVLGLAESVDQDGRNVEMLDKLLTLIEAKDPEAFAKIDKDNIDEKMVLELYNKLVEAAVKPVKPTEKPAEKPAATVTEGALAEAVKGIESTLTEANNTFMNGLARQNAEGIAQSMLAESELKSKSFSRVLAQVNSTEKPATREDITKLIESEVEYIGESVQKWTGPGSTSSNVAIGADAQDKWFAATAGLIANEPSMAISEAEGAEKIDSFTSIREAYIALTGDVHVTGEVDDAPHVGRTAEAAITASTFGNALGSILGVQMQRAYKAAPYDQWRLIADTPPVSDFRVQTRAQVGGFGNIDVVAEGAAYTETWTEPDDVGPKYSASKKGNLQTITLEAIANDNVSLFQRFPIKMGRAAARTLSDAAWSPLINNSAYTDTTDTDTIFHANHGGNLGSSALSSASINAGLLVMKKQAEPQSTERMSLRGRYLFTPDDLERTAFELVYATGQPVIDLSTAATSDSETRPNFLKTIGLDVVAIPNFSDTNNWIIGADKMDIPMLEVGFLGGRQDPELFIQDMPNVGSMFTNDKLTYKIRHIYGVTVLDWRGFYGAVVA